jgi:DNA polymerase I
MAGLSGDLNLKRDLLEGDLYSSIANLTYGARYLGKDEGKKAGTDSYVMRQAAKFAFLAWGYGCGAAKLAGLLGITVAEAQAALRRWEAAYPDLIRFRNRVNQQPAAFLESGWIAPLWDRYFVDDKGIHLSTKPSRLGLNYYTQGSQAYLLRVALHRIIDWGWSWALFHTMHDEILLCVPAHMGDQAAQVLKAAMSMDWHGIPIECDVDKPPYSQRWAEYPDDYLLSANDIVNEFDEDLSELLGV